MSESSMNPPSLLAIVSSVVPGGSVEKLVTFVVEYDGVNVHQHLFAV
jgi:hypothetical protein